MLDRGTTDQIRERQRAMVLRARLGVCESESRSADFDLSCCPSTPAAELLVATDDMCRAVGGASLVQTTAAEQQRLRRDRPCIPSDQATKWALRGPLLGGAGRRIAARVRPAPSPAIPVVGVGNRVDWPFVHRSASGARGPLEPKGAR